MPTDDQGDEEPYELDADTKREGSPLYWISVAIAVGIAIAVLRYQDVDPDLDKLILLGISGVGALVYYAARPLVRRVRRGQE